MINLTFNILKSNIDWANIITMVMTTIISAIVSAIVAIKVAESNNKKQFELFDKQIDEQRMLWKNENLYKYRQDKLLELRKIYINFQTNVFDFLSLFIPSSIGASILDPTLNKSLKYEYKALKFFESPSSMINRFLTSSNILCEFLKENDIFLQDKSELKEDLNALAKTFQELFGKLDKNNGLENLFLPSSASNEYTLVPQNPSFCKYFYKFMNGHLYLKRGETRIHLFYLYENSIFKNNKLSFEDGEIDNWCSNIIVLFGTSMIFYTWLKHISNSIDSYFVASLEEIQNLSLKTSVKKDNNSENNNN